MKIPESKIITILLADDKNLTVGRPTGQKEIYVYLPKGYDPERQKPYKTIYMFDGQNAFEKKSEGYALGAPNSWAIDLELEEFYGEEHDCIVVGINNGEGSEIRDSQLTMSKDFGRLTPLGAPEYGSFKDGSLELFTQFITETLLPYIAENFNTSQKAEDRFLLGASSGGLAALYVGLKCGHLFGGIGALSPATGLFYRDSWDSFVSALPNELLKNKIYLYCGRSTEDFLEQMLYCAPDESILSAYLVRELLAKHGYEKSLILESFLDGGIHNEVYWRKALKEYFKFVLN